MKEWMTRIGDKLGALGALTAAMGCAFCFPALGTLAGALGLGFLSQWEGLFINTLLPAFAWLALGANALAFLQHRRPLRAALAVAGPMLLLLALYPFWQYAWSTALVYSALALMIAVAILDLIRPARRHCPPFSSKSGTQEP